MYSGISKNVWETIFKNKNLNIKKNINITDDFDFALGYSYDFNTGNYDDIVMEIHNIPLDAFIYARDDEYNDDNDIIYIGDLSDIEKKYYIDNYSLFEINVENCLEQLKFILLDENKNEIDKSI